MAEKRSFSEIETPAKAQDSQQGPARKKHKKKKHKAREGSINWIKKRARTIDRTLGRDESKIPQTRRRELERERLSHQKRIDEAKEKKLRQKMISKYHMVRFFGMSICSTLLPDEPKLVY